MCARRAKPGSRDEIPCGVQGQSPWPAEQKNKRSYLSKLPVVMRLGETPLPIPNRTVKTQTAYDTWLATARESEWLPELF